MNKLLIGMVLSLIVVISLGFLLYNYFRTSELQQLSPTDIAIIIHAIIVSATSLASVLIAVTKKQIFMRKYFKRES